MLSLFHETRILYTLIIEYENISIFIIFGNQLFLTYRTVNKVLINILQCCHTAFDEDSLAQGSVLQKFANISVPVASMVSIQKIRMFQLKNSLIQLDSGAFNVSRHVLVKISYSESISR